MSVMELGHLLTRSGLTYLELSSEVCHDSFCQLENSVISYFSPLCNTYHLFTPPFLIKQARHGRNIIYLYFFCLQVVALNVYSARHVRFDVCNSSCLVLQWQSVVYLEQ